MSFDSNLPVDASKIVAAELRNQLNGLNDKIDAQAGLIANQTALITELQTQNTAQAAINANLQGQIDALATLIGSLAARIAALEAAAISLTAFGFGEMGANGKLTQIGMFAGKPMYQAAGGWYYCWNEAGGMWICRDALPGTGDLSNNRYADNGYAADIKDVVWGPGFNPGMMPYGTVS